MTATRDMSALERAIYEHMTGSTPEESDKKIVENLLTIIEIAVGLQEKMVEAKEHAKLALEANNSMVKDLHMRKVVEILAGAIGQ